MERRFFGPDDVSIAITRKKKSERQKLEPLLDRDPAGWIEMPIGGELGWQYMVRFEFADDYNQKTGEPMGTQTMYKCVHAKNYEQELYLIKRKAIRTVPKEK